MSRNPRDYTNNLIELVDNGIIDKDRLIRNLLCFMSEDEVKDFAITNEYLEDEEDEEDEN